MDPVLQKFRDYLDETLALIERYIKETEELFVEMDSKISSTEDGYREIDTK